MRMLTADEIGCVSGGEAPCITRNTPCVGPPPTAEELSNILAGAAAVAGAIAVETGTKLAARVTAALAIAHWIMEQFATDDENHTQPGGQTHNTPPGGGSPGGG